MEFERDVLVSPTTEVPVIEGEVVTAIRTLAGRGVGKKAIAREVGVAVNTVRRYLRQPIAAGQSGATGGAAADRRSARRRRGRSTQGPAAGNAVVVQRLLAERGLRDERADDRAGGGRHSTRAARGGAGDGPRGNARRAISCRSTSARSGCGLPASASGSFSWSRCSATRAASSSKRFSMSAATIGARASPRPSRISAACRGRCSATMRARWCSVATARPGTVSFHPAYLAFCRDWDVQPRACAPYRARTKGKTEAGVKYVKRNALADQTFDSFGALEQHLAAWMTMADQRRHGTTREAPIVRFERDERAILRPLPLRALPRRTQRLRRRVALDAFVDVDTVRYSVPHRLVRDHVEVVVEDHPSGSFTAPSWSRRTRDRPSRLPAWSTSAHYAGLWRSGAGRRADAGLALLGRDLADYAAVVDGGQ